MVLESQKESIEVCREYLQAGGVPKLRRKEGKEFTSVPMIQMFRQPYHMIGWLGDYMVTVLNLTFLTHSLLEVWQVDLL